MLRGIVMGAQMHPYATDSTEREKVFAFLAVVTIGVLWLLDYSLGSYKWFWNPITIMGIYGFLYLLFGKYLWKAGFLRLLRLIRTPNLGGEWSGKIKLSSKWLGKTKDAKITIRQSWTRIAVVFETESTRARSVIASILIKGPQGPVLSFEYLNEPKPGSKDAYNINRGSARLLLSGGTLEGDFYYGSGRQQTFGILKVTKDA